MSSQQPPGFDDTVDSDEASVLLEVPPDRIEVLVQEGLLTPLPDTEERRFRRAEVLAVRDLGA